MFRRTKPEETTSATPGSAKPGGKGRPTPSRREAEAAARARAKAAAGKKSARRGVRQGRAEQNARMREAMRSGDERYLPARDQGRVRRFVRDRVDARFTMAELLLPLLLVIIAMTYSGNDMLSRYGQSLWLATIVLVSLDTVLLVIRLRKDLKERFPEESHRGAVLYGVLRAMQLRFLRMPKPQVRIGERLPDRY